ncbi:MAG TPA: hypothetical protein VGJ66_17470 [Pyrinomonadaceae bacterium]|jgi:hypothetical protein
MVSNNLDEIQINLPNGFHDANMYSIIINYAERTLVFDLMLWVGDLESSDEAEREAVIALIISTVSFCAVTLALGRLSWKKYHNLANRGVVTEGRITVKQPANHMSVEYSYINCLDFPSADQDEGPIRSAKQGAGGSTTQIGGMTPRIGAS